MEESIVKKQRKIDELSNNNDVNRNLYSANNNFINNLEKHINKADEEKLEVEENISLFENQYENLKYKKINMDSKLDLKLRDKKKIQIELDKLEKDVKYREQDIKQNNIIIDKKQLDLDQLNKDYYKLKDRNNGEEEVGELGLKLTTLRKKLAEQEDKNKYLNNEWMKCQTGLIKWQENMNDEEETAKEIKNKSLVLENKKRRIETQVSTEIKEIKDLKHRLKQLQTDLNRLNDS